MIKTGMAVKGMLNQAYGSLIKLRPTRIAFIRPYCPSSNHCHNNPLTTGGIAQGNSITALKIPRPGNFSLISNASNVPKITVRLIDPAQKINVFKAASQN